MGKPAAKSESRSSYLEVALNHEPCAAAPLGPCSESGRTLNTLFPPLGGAAQEQATGVCRVGDSKWGGVPKIEMLSHRPGKMSVAGDKGDRKD